MLHFVFQKKEVNTILGDIINHVSSDRSYEKFYPQVLLFTVQPTFTSYSDFPVNGCFDIISTLPIPPSNKILEHPRKHSTFLTGFGYLPYSNVALNLHSTFIFYTVGVGSFEDFDSRQKFHRCICHGKSDWYF